MVERLWRDAAAALGVGPASVGCGDWHPVKRPRPAGPFDPSLACMLSLRRIICLSGTARSVLRGHLPHVPLAVARLRQIRRGSATFARQRMLTSAARPGVATNAVPGSLATVSSANARGQAMARLRNGGSAKFPVVGSTSAHTHGTGRTRCTCVSLAKASIARARTERRRNSVA